MSRVLRRPMFRGGKVDSYNTGIASGLGDNKRRGFQFGGSPAYPAGFSAVPQGGITGADVKKMAEKKVFLSGFGKDTAQLNSTLKDLYMNYIQAPLEKGGNRAIDYMFGTEFEDKDAPFFKDQDDFRRIYERDVLPLASKMSAEMIPQISSDEEYDEAYMTPEEVKLRNRERIMSITPTPREQAILDQEGADQVKKIMDRKKGEEMLAEAKGGGKDASQADFEIPAGVTEMEGEQETGTDGGAIGYKELADSYFEAMNAGADERMQQRLKDLDAKSAERIKKARIADLSDLGLSIFAKSQKEGATVGSMLGSAAEDLIAKPSRTEKEKDRADLRREKLEDTAAARKEGRFDTATQMAFKEMMTEKGFDFKDLQNERSINAAMDRLKLQLESAETVAEKKIIAARIRDLEMFKNKQFAPGITEKNTQYLASLVPGTKEHRIAMAQSGFASNIFKQAENEMAEYGEGSGSEYTASDVLADGPLYYEDWGGLWKNDGTQGDGVYLIEATSEILTVRNGEPVSRQKINIAKPKVKT
jgi:hypothetical protein